MSTRDQLDRAERDSERSKPRFPTVLLVALALWAGVDMMLRASGRGRLLVLVSMLLLLLLAVVYSRWEHFRWLDGTPFRRWHVGIPVTVLVLGLMGLTGLLSGNNGSSSESPEPDASESADVAAQPDDDPTPASDPRAGAICDELTDLAASGGPYDVNPLREATAELDSADETIRLEEAVRDLCQEALSTVRVGVAAAGSQARPSTRAAGERARPGQTSSNDEAFYLMVAAWQTLSPSAQASICVEVSRGMTEAVAAGRTVSDAVGGTVAPTEAAAFLRTVC